MKIKIFCLFISIILFYQTASFSAISNVKSITPNYVYNTTNTLISVNGEIFDSSSKIFIESSNPYIIGNLKVLGEAKNVYVSGDYAYIASGVAGLQIANISDTKNPIFVGGVDTDGVSFDVSVKDNYAYVADGLSGLQIINITDRNNPIITGHILTGGWLYSVYISGNYVYAVDGPSGLYIIDITNPLNPITIGRYNNNTNIYGVSVSGNYVYLATGWLGLQILDITDPTKPIEISSINTYGCAYGVYISDHYAYIANGTSGFLMIDIKDVSNPNIVGSVYTSGSVFKVYVLGDYAYAADGTSGLYIINISIANKPSVVLNVSIPSYGVCVENNNVFCANGKDGLQILDISSPKISNTIVSSINVSGYSRSVFVSGDYAYNANDFSGLQIIDIKDQRNPIVVGTINTINSAPYGIYISGDYAYIAAGDLLVVDVKDPKNPAVISTVDITGYARNIYISGNYAYCVSDYVGLHTIDISDPKNPVIIGSYYNPSGSFGIQVSGNLAYIASGWAGLQIVDVSDPSKPTLLNTLTTIGGFGNGVNLSDNYAYLASGLSGLQIFDISDPLKAKLVGNIKNGSWVYNVRVVDKYAYCATGNGGLLVVDVTSKTNPIIVGNLNNISYLSDLYISGDYIYCATYNDFQIVNKLSVGTALESVEYIDETKFIAGIPMGLMPGKYDIKIIEKSMMAYTFYSGFTVLGEFPNRFPLLELNVSSDTGNAPMLITFTALGTDVDGSITSYEWDFDGNGTYESTTTNNILSHNYIVGGTYNAKVRVTDNNGAKTESSKKIIINEDINQSPELNLIVSKNSGTVPLLVDFIAEATDSDGSIISYEWDFDGNGIYDTSTNINNMSYNYTISGTYNVKVRVTDNNGAKKEDIDVIRMVSNQPPLISLDVSVDSGTVPLVVDFVASAIDSDGSIISYEWDFDGNGIYDTTTNINNMSYNYTTPGSYKATVRVVDNNNAKNEDSKSIIINEIQNQLPVINLISNKNSGTVPLLVDFIAEATDSDGSIISYEWDFDGNGTYDTTTNINNMSYTYTIPGSYEATVRVTDNNNSKVKDIETIITVINQLPIIKLVISANSGTVPLMVDFIAEATDSDGSIISYEWDFDGNGTYDTSTNINNMSYNYTTPGSYKATVRVVDNNNAKNEDSKSIIVNEQKTSKKKTCIITNIITNINKTENIKYYNRFRDISLMSNFFSKYLVEIYYKVNPVIIRNANK